MKLPKFYRWGGGPIPYYWSFGWLTGKHNDLVCVKPHIQTEEEEIALSPVCSNRLVALLAWAAKVILLRTDRNLRI